MKIRVRNCTMYVFFFGWDKILIFARAKVRPEVHFRLSTDSNLSSKIPILGKKRVDR